MPTHSSQFIILASTSPRRHELLNQVDIKHTCFAVEIDETVNENEQPTAYIERMVTAKALAVIETLQTSLATMPTYSAVNLADADEGIIGTTNRIQQTNSTVIISADTIGMLPSGEVLQKPKDFVAACQMWQQMSGTTHQVWTAVQVNQVRYYEKKLIVQRQLTTLVKTEVLFIPLTTAMMQAYWQTGEPRDKAGGYGIQARGAAWVKAIHGSYSNVVGLPLVETLDLLAQCTADSHNNIS